MADPTLVTNPDLTESIRQLNRLLSQLVEGGSHLVTGGMAAHALEYLKGKSTIAKVWATFSDRARTVVSAGVAAAAGAGIVITFQHDSHGHFMLMADNLTWTTAGVFLWSSLQNWLWQQAWFMAVIKDKAVVGPTPTPAHPTPPPVPVIAAGV